MHCLLLRCSERQLKTVVYLDCRKAKHAVVAAPSIVPVTVQQNAVTRVSTNEAWTIDTPQLAVRTVFMVANPSKSTIKAVLHNMPSCVD